MNADKNKTSPARSYLRLSAFICGLMFLHLAAPAATVRFAWTNSVGNPDTNWFIVYPVGDVAQADGSFITKGPVTRLTPNASGLVTNTFEVGTYVASNRFLGRGIAFRVPNDHGPTVYCATCGTNNTPAGTGLAISGFNYFITITYGTNPPPTYDEITNSLGFLPGIDGVALTNNESRSVTLANTLTVADKITAANMDLDYATANSGVFWAADGVLFRSRNGSIYTNLALTSVVGLEAALDYLTNTISSGGEATNVYQVAAGTNIVVITNGLLYTIHGTAAGSGLSNPLTENLDFDGWLITNIFGLRPQAGETIEIQNAVIDGTFTGNGAGITNLPIQSAVRYVSKVRPSNNDTNWFGAWTPGTVTEGFQEAIDSLPRGTETGPSTAGGAIVFTDGIFFFTNNIYYSNHLTYAVSLRAENPLMTKVVYAGTQSGTNLIWFRGGPHTVDGGPASLNLPAHVWVKGLTLSSINPNTNVLLCITNDSWWKVENVNFTGWQATTNQDWGSAMSLNGLTYYTNDTGLVGLVAGNVNDHSGTVRDCSFAGLAVGGVFYTDHLVMQGFKTAMVGVDGNGRYNNLWPTNHPYALGFGFLRYPRLDSHYEDGHFYGTAGGFGYMNYDGGSLPGDVQYMENIVFENDPPFIAAIVTNKVIWVYNGVYEVNGAIPFSANSQYRINTNDYKHPVQAPLILNGVVYNNPAYLVAPLADGGFNLRSGVFSGDGSGLTNVTGSGGTGIATNAGSGVNNTLSNLTVSLSGPDKTLTWKLPGNLNDTGTKILWQNTNTISTLELNSLSDGEFKTWLRFDVNDTASGMFLWKPYGDGGLLTGDDEAYGAGWNGDLTMPTKNAVYDKIETISGGGGDGRGWDTNGNSGLSAANVLGTLDNVNLKLVASNSVMANLSGYSNTIVLGDLSEIIGWQPYSVIGGGRSNLITGATNSANWFRLGYNTIAGGGSNTITSEVSGGNTIGGGLLNSIVGDPDDASVVAGGKLNNATGETATIGGGYNNDIGTAAAFGTIGGGIDNLIVGSSAAPRTNDYATISGGHSNRASGAYAVIPGGNQNLASGSNSIAMGFKASATHPGSVVISADVSATTGQASPANNSFTVNATGGINLLGSSITGNGAGLTNLNQFAFTTNRYSFHPGNTGNGGANAVTDSTPDETGNSIWYAATNGSNPRIHAWYLAAGANRFVWGFVPNERTLGRTNCAITARFMTTNESYFGYSLTANVMDRQSVSNSLVSGNGFVSNDGTTLSVIRAGTNIISVSRVFAVKPNLTNAVWEFAIGVGATVNSTNSVFFIDADADFY